MLASPEDAFLLFQKWKEHASRLEARLRNAGLIFDAAGLVVDCSPTTLQLAGESWTFTVPLDGATFTFSDPREIPVASVREAQSSRYEFGLSVEFPNGDKLALMELKGD